MLRYLLFIASLSTVVGGCKHQTAAGSGVRSVVDTPAGSAAETADAYGKVAGANDWLTYADAARHLALRGRCQAGRPVSEAACMDQAFVMDSAKLVAALKARLAASQDFQNNLSAELANTRKAVAGLTASQILDAVASLDFSDTLDYGPVFALQQLSLKVEATIAATTYFAGTLADLQTPAGSAAFKDDVTQQLTHLINVSVPVATANNDGNDGTGGAPTDLEQQRLAILNAALKGIFDDERAADPSRNAQAFARANGTYLCEARCDARMTLATPEATAAAAQDIQTSPGWKDWGVALRPYVDASNGSTILVYPVDFQWPKFNPTTQSWNRLSYAGNLDGADAALKALAAQVCTLDNVNRIMAKATDKNFDDSDGSLVQSFAFYAKGQQTISATYVFNQATDCGLTRDIDQALGLASAAAQP